MIFFFTNRQKSKMGVMYSQSKQSKSVDIESSGGLNFSNEEDSYKPPNIPVISTSAPFQKNTKESVSNSSNSITKSENSELNILLDRIESDLIECQKKKKSSKQRREGLMNLLKNEIDIDYYIMACSIYAQVLHGYLEVMIKEDTNHNNNHHNLSSTNNTNTNNNNNKYPAAHYSDALKNQYNHSNSNGNSNYNNIMLMTTNEPHKTLHRCKLVTTKKDVTFDNCFLKKHEIIFFDNLFPNVTVIASTHDINVYHIISNKITYYTRSNSLALGSYNLDLSDLKVSVIHDLHNLRMENNYDYILWSITEVITNCNLDELTTKHLISLYTGIKLIYSPHKAFDIQIKDFEEQVEKFETHFKESH